MHIVINAFSARRGGGKTYLLNLLRYFPFDESLSVTLLVSNSFSVDSLAQGIRLERVDFPVDNPLFRVFWETFVLPFYLRRLKADVLFCPGGSIPVLSHGPWTTVTMFRNMIPFDLEQRKKYPLGYMRLRNWLLSHGLMRSMESADFVIFISSYARQVIEQRSRKGIKNSTVIPHGISDDFRKGGMEEPERPAFLPEQTFIVYPSIIDAYKSQIEVVKAIALLRARHIELPVLLLVGEIYGRYGEQVRQLIDELDLQHQIKLIGAISYENMPLLYHFAEFVVFASRSENCPNILLEALASASAILCSNRMPMPEFAGDAVLYFNPDNPEDLATQIHMLLNKPELKQELQYRAERRSTEYSWRETADKTWSILQNQAGSM